MNVVAGDSSEFKQGRNVALERGINPPQRDGGSNGMVSVKCVGRSESGWSESQTDARCV